VSAEGRCLALGNGEATGGLVALDLLGFFYSDMEPLRRRLEPEVDHPIVAATHKDSGSHALPC
jgi:hypothetical protein